ncbi:MAG TPA: hypothetical protein VGL97_20820 [Bryobacteraceae bacterium]
MRLSEAALRGVLAVIYCLVAFLVLVSFSAGDPFCVRPGARNHILLTAQLALALTIYDFLIGTGTSAVTNSAKDVAKSRWITPFVATLIVGCSLAYLPSWVYRGYGHFRFEHTWADVSCFFTEGYGLAFMFVVAPVMALTTFLRELAILRLQRQRN